MGVVDVREVLGLHDAVAAFGLRSLDLHPRRAPVDDQLRPLGAPLLVVHGAMLRTVDLLQRTGAELLGQGDPISIGVDNGVIARHRVLTPTRLAVLEASRLPHLARSPDILAGVFDRAERRNASIAAQIIGFQFNSLDDRLSLLLAELADRWGTMTRDGVTLPAYLSHTVLAALAGARRPSLTNAIVRLTEAGKIRRLEDRRWLVDPDFLQL